MVRLQVFRKQARAGPGHASHTFFAQRGPWLDGHLKSAYRGIWPVPVISVISVSRPLDYEQISNGLIYLTVMAKDAGNPPLNSTVPVTIEVFVSTQGHWPCPSRSWESGEEEMSWASFIYGCVL